jgi:hypothetical protein
MLWRSPHRVLAGRLAELTNKPIICHREDAHFRGGASSRKGIRFKCLWRSNFTLYATPALTQCDRLHHADKQQPWAEAFFERDLALRLHKVTVQVVVSLSSDVQEPGTKDRMTDDSFIGGTAERQGVAPHTSRRRPTCTEHAADSAMAVHTYI